MSFQLSPEVDGNKMFLVRRGELEGRFDPHFYKPFFRNNTYRLKDIPNVDLGNVTRFSNESWNQKNIFSTTFPYIEIGEIDLLTGEIKKITDINIKDAPSRAKMIVRNGDILISTTRPNRGAISHLRDDNLYIASTGFSIIREITATNINKRFLFYWLRQPCSLYQMEQRSSGGNYPAITQEELAKIRIPAPPKEIQAEIVTKMDAAYATKKQKEAEAQRLLNSIDDYLLGELGIKLPEQEENTIESRIFKRRLSEVSGGRFDPNYHFNIAKIAGCDAIYNTVKLNDIIKNSPQYGANEPSVDGVTGSNTRYIRITDISEIGELKNDSWKTAETIEHQYLLHKNDLLFARSGSVGRAYLHKDTKEDAIFAGYLIRFVIDESMSNPNYIFFYCHSAIYRLWVEAVYRPSVQANINAEEYKMLPIVLPPLAKQTEIADHITEIRNQAKALQQQAKAQLEQAKKEVEAMILGAE